MFGLLAGCSSGRSFVRPGYDFKTLGRVAVVCTSPCIDLPKRKQVSDLFTMELLRKGLQVADRANIDELLAEDTFQNDSGITSESGRSRLALHNLQAVVVVNVTRCDKRVQMTAKMVELSSGDVLWSGEGRGDLKQGLATLGGALLGAGAGATAGGLAGRSTTGAVVGGVAGGLGGGVVGAALEPDEADLVSNVIEKVCKGAPSLIKEQ
jgi:hypothetical protein